MATASIFGPAALEPFPEGFEGLDAFAVAHEHDRSLSQVQDHRQVPMPPADRDFVDRDLSQVLERDAAELGAQIPLLDVLDEVPADLQMLGHVLDGHVSGQVQDVPLEGFGVVPSFSSEVHRHLANLAAVDTADSRDLQRDLDRSAADGKTAKPTRLTAPTHDLPRPTNRTTKIAPFLTDREDHPAFLIRRLHIPIASNPKPVIQ